MCGQNYDHVYIYHLVLDFFFLLTRVEDNSYDCILCIIPSDLPVESVIHSFRMRKVSDDDECINSYCQLL